MILKNFKNKNFSSIKIQFFLDDIVIDRFPKKISCGKNNYKYFIGYLYDNHKIKLLHIMLPKTRVYVKDYDSKTKWMYFFLIEDDELLQRYNII